MTGTQGAALTDRELLERAARAAGIKLERSRLDDPMWRDFLLVERDQLHNGIGQGWNPLTDDGDAFRLAVKLRMKITVGNAITMAEVVGRPDVGVEHYEGADAATRRAIVRAAAALAAADSAGEAA